MRWNNPCWSLSKLCLSSDSPDNHYTWDTCIFRCSWFNQPQRKMFNLKKLPKHLVTPRNGWISLDLSNPALNPSFATDYLVLLDSVVGGKKASEFKPIYRIFKKKWIYTFDIHSYTHTHIHTHVSRNQHLTTPHSSLMTNHLLH